jgi:hypothetical protein
MELKPDDVTMERWIVLQTSGNHDEEPVVWRIGNQNDPTDVNTAVYRDFRKERSLVMTHLQGCTGLAIIGRKAVYMSHYWENLSFAPDKKLKLKGESDEEAFKRTVLDGLRKGVTYPGKAQQLSLTKFAQEFGDKDENLRAYLIRPMKAADQDQGAADEAAGRAYSPVEAHHGYPGYVLRISKWNIANKHPSTSVDMTKDLARPSDTPHQSFRGPEGLHDIIIRTSRMLFGITLTCPHRTLGTDESRHHRNPPKAWRRGTLAGGHVQSD